MMLANCKCHVCGELIPLTEPIYCYDDKDGNENNYHMLCYCSQTTQGIQGFKPSKIYPPFSTADYPEEPDESDSFGF